MSTLIDEKLEMNSCEKCIVCNGNTPYTLKNKISERNFYINGCGQLCEECYRELYGQNIVDSNEDSDVQGYEVPSTIIMPYDYTEDEHYYIENLGKIPQKHLYSFIKRAFDIVASIAALIILALPMLAIALAIKISSQGPVLYKQERLGLNGKRFTILKFRSMYKDAEKAGATWSNGLDDSRITPVGRILRKFRLDELPPLFCTLYGTMTIVGPRPERECFYREFEKHVHGFSERLKVKPGITGLAQVNSGHDLSPHEKVVWDVKYIKERSLKMDLLIMLKTVKTVFSHEGAK